MKLHSITYLDLLEGIIDNLLNGTVACYIKIFQAIITHGSNSPSKEKRLIEKNILIVSIIPYVL